MGGGFECMDGGWGGMVGGCGGFSVVGCFWVV